MSVNVLLIPEDFRKDQYVLKPIVEKLMASIVAKPRVRICCDPLLGGVDQATNWERIAEIIERYRGMTRVFLLIVDRDGDVGRRAALDVLEAKAADALVSNRAVLLAENAWQELEVWVLAGMTDLPNAWRWVDIRAERDPKETYYDVYAGIRGMREGPQAGREPLAREAATRYARIRQLCPEDVGRLEDRVRSALAVGS